MERWIGIWLPFLEATEAGLWMYFVMRDVIIAVERPALRLLDDRLHCADGPAVFWPHGARYYFWRGLQVPERLILAPESLTTVKVLAERNAELRRAMVERMGHDRFVLESGATPIHQDACGTLYRIALPDDEPLVLVHVVNATAEPDGSAKRYFLRVPPDMERARQAVAWTFGLREEQYAPAVET